MARLTISVATEKLQLLKPFRISGHVFEAFEVVVVTLGDGRHQGRGEACGVYYLGDNAAHMLAVLDGASAAIAAGISREELRAILPPGGARNAVDCALWELEAARAGVPVWQLAQLRVRNTVEPAVPSAVRAPAASRKGLASETASEPT